MKKFILLAFVLVSSLANAAEIVVMEENIPTIRNGRPIVDTRFYMDTKTGEGFVKASLSEEILNPFPPHSCTYYPNGRCYPEHRGPSRQIYHIMSKTNAVEGLMLMGKDAVYHGAQGNVVCGTMGVSRIFKIPTLYLSGNCKLNSKIVKQGRQHKLVVTLKTND